jgi:hypothetical protein
MTGRLDQPAPLSADNDYEVLDWRKPDDGA